MIEDWIERYFSEEQIPEVLDILSEYGTESWHREEERVNRDVIIISRGSMEKLKATVNWPGTIITMYSLVKKSTRGLSANSTNTKLKK